MKELIVQYVDNYRKVARQESLMNDLFRKLNQDNSIMEIVPKSTRELIDEMAIVLFGHDVFDWLEWYMWEADFGTDDKTFSVGLTSYNVSNLSLDKFLDIILK